MRKEQLKDGAPVQVEDRRTKVVIRELPPSLSQFDLFSQFHHLFSHRYNWFRFIPASATSSCRSKTHRRYSRAYIHFNTPADVVDFAHFFHGRIFLRDNGAQFKAIVEFAPSQRVPKPSAINHGCEGTIYKDPDYLEFLKLIAKPVRKILPSSEIQLDTKQAQQSDAARELPTTTPLMEFVRRKRAAQSRNQDSFVAVSGGKSAGSASVIKPGSSANKQGTKKKKDSLVAVSGGKRAGSASVIKPGSSANKQGTKKKKDSLVAVSGGKRAGSASVIKPDSSANKRGAKKKKCILKNRTQNSNQMDKSASVMAPGQENEHATLSGKEILEIQSGAGEEKKMLIKGKNHEISAVSRGMLQQSGNEPVSAAPKKSQRFRACERIIKGTLLNNEAHQTESLGATQHRRKIQNLNEHDKQSPQLMNNRAGFDGYVPSSEPSAPISDGDTKGDSDGKFLTKSRSSLGSACAKQEKCEMDKPDCGVWDPHCYSVIPSDKEENLSSTVLQLTGLNSDSFKGRHKHFGRSLAAHRMKDGGSLIASKQKSSKRGGASLHAVQEKQVWVQKSATGS